MSAPRGRRIESEKGRFVVETESQVAAVPPDACACCMGGAEELMALPAYMDGEQTGASWEFPFCSACLAHQRGHTRNWIIGLAPGGLVTGAILWHGGFPNMPEGKTFAAFMLGGLIAFVAKVVLSALLPGRGPRCSAEAAVVVCVGPFAGGRYRFSFTSRRFAEKFAQLNAG